MGLFHHDSSEAKAHGQVNIDSPYSNCFESADSVVHKVNAGADLSTEMLAGAASYEAAKAFEVHVDEHGIPESHEKMQELVTGYVGNWIDEIVQARGVEGVDISLAKKEGACLSVTELSGGSYTCCL